MKTPFDKSFSLNYFRLNKMFWAHGDIIFPTINKLREKYHIPKDLETIDLVKEKKNFIRILDSSDKKLDEFRKENKEMIPKIYLDLDKLRDELGLGREWNSCFFRYMITGIAFPPPFSLFFYENEKSIVIEVNKNTTKSDIDSLWNGPLKDLRKEKYKNVRSNYPNKKSWKNFNDFAISTYSKEKNVSSSEQEKYKKKDIDIVGELFENDDDISEEADKKRQSNLRVNRHRFKKITK
jgi:hypothetical protein